jgi:hypothetical protein
MLEQAPRQITQATNAQTAMSFFMPLLIAATVRSGEWKMLALATLRPAFVLAGAAARC